VLMEASFNRVPLSRLRERVRATAVPRGHGLVFARALTVRTG
jgi:hypothetical protein